MHFVSKFNNSLTILSESTFLGGSGEDIGQNIAVDASNNVFVIRVADGSGFPTTYGAYDTLLGGYADAFVSKFNTSTYVELVSFTGKANRDGAVT